MENLLNDRNGVGAVARSFQTALLDAIFPPTCISCEADGEWLCEKCVSKINLRHHTSCRLCGVSGHNDEPCKGDWPFASFTTLASYSDPIVRTLITRFKYDAATCLLPAFERVLKRFRDEWRDVWPWADCEQVTFVPIPSDPTHIRQRGFDHTAILADSFRNALCPWSEVQQPFYRQARKWKNADLPDPALRKANVSGALTLLNPLQGDIFMIDDVVTSGSTAREAASLLRRPGTNVHLLTVGAG